MKTILLVDDRPENRLSLEALLLQGHPDLEVQQAASGNEALQYLLRHPGTDLVLMDVQMPGMDGYEAAALLRQVGATAGIPVVFVTADADEKEAPEPYQSLLSPVRYLYKPVDAAALSAVLEKGFSG